MATSVPVSLAEYLRTAYRPDREYMDGVIVERNVGSSEHSRVQSLLAGWFGQHEQTWNLQTALGWRTQVSKTRVRVPDVVLVRRGAQPEVLDSAPLLIVEILSPDDTYSDTQERANDYLAMGVDTIWIIDPKTRTARVCSGRTWTQTARLEVAGTPIYVDLDTLFAPLDERGALL